MSRYAIANGNWSNPAIWDGGTLPLAGETVRPNNFTVTIDINTPANMTIRTNASAPAVQGGTFILNSGCVFNGDIYFDVTILNYTFPALSYSGIGIGQINGLLYCNSVYSGNRVVEFSGPGQLNINGNLTGLTNSSSRLINITGVTTGTLNLFGDIITFSNTTGITSTGTQPNINVIGNVIGNPGAAIGISVTSGISTINVTGSVIAGIGGGHGISLSTASTVNVTGNVTGSAATLTTYGIYCLGAANVTVNGTITAQNGAGVYVNNAINATINANGIVTGSSLNNGIYNNAGSTTFSGLLIQNGDFAAILSQRLIINSTNTISSKIRDNIGGFRYMYTAGIPLGNPAESDVRDSITYGPSNELTGTLIVPDPSDVRKSVPTDNTVGTAELTSDDLFAAIETSPHPIAVLIRNLATEQKVGAIVAAAVS